MKLVFADTVYWSALLTRSDDLHPKAIQLSQSLDGVQIVTSDLVLIEFLNAVAGRGPQSRFMASSSVESLLKNPETMVERLTPESLQAALKLCSERPDKDWSLTGCSSFLIMNQLDIRQALTYDRHFEQAGFQALLR